MSMQIKKMDLHHTDSNVFRTGENLFEPLFFFLNLCQTLEKVRYIPEVCEFALRDREVYSKYSPERDLRSGNILSWTEFATFKKQPHSVPWPLSRLQPSVKHWRQTKTCQHSITRETSYAHSRKTPYRQTPDQSRHEDIQHQGWHLTEGALRALRADRYWVTGTKRLNALHMHKCVLCRKLRRLLELRKMSDWRWCIWALEHHKQKNQRWKCSVEEMGCYVFMPNN